MQPTILTIEKQDTTPSTAAAAGKTQTKRSFLIATVEFAALLCLSILALEAFFNFAGVGSEEFLEPDSSLGLRHIAGKKVVWRLEGFSDELLSKQGLRDTEHTIAKPAGVYRIALLGDSATEGLQVPLRDTFGKQLEQILNKSGKLKGSAEVLNFGCSDYSNGQEMLLLAQQVKAFQPDLVVMMYNRSDYIENIRDPNTMKADVRPYFHLNQNSELVQDNTIMDFNKDAFKPHPITDFLRNNSRIYGILSHMNLALSLNELLYSKTRNSIMKLLPGTKDQWKRAVAPYTIQDPWKVTEAVIDRTNADCKGMKSKFLLICFPNVVKDGEYFKQIAALRQQAENRNFGFVDMTADCLSNANPKSFFLKYHFSAAGHELAARKLADAIAKQ